MRLTEDYFRRLVVELIEENPFAVRPVLQILETRFTDSVPTLAVTLQERPVLLVNLRFLARHCRTDEHVKACLLHEFLHVMLGHTRRFKDNTFNLNVALDAVINAIIHRTAGSAYSDFFAQYYADRSDALALLRPPDPSSKTAFQNPGGSEALGQAWQDLYEGKLVADDILDLARTLPPPDGAAVFVGNHEGLPWDDESHMAEAIRESLRQCRVPGIVPGKSFGAGTWPSAFRCRPNREAVELERWKRRTFAVLKRHLVPNGRGLAETAERSYRVPIPSPRDRRGFLRALWSPIVPEFEWAGSTTRPTGTANVYLDVSGSMNHEMPLIIELLFQLRRAVRNPFWAFSNEVAPATIRNGRLETTTTGGTSLNCVLQHLARTRPSSAVVVTDGYIEQVDRQSLHRVRDVRLVAVVTRKGSTAELERAGIPFTQLEELPR